MTATNDGYGLQMPGADWQIQAFKTAVAANREWLGFVSYRMKQDADFADRLVSCHGSDEIWSVSSDFWSRAATDYQNELAKLMKIGTAGMTGAGADENDGRERTSGRGPSPRSSA